MEYDQQGLPHPWSMITGMTTVSIHLIRSAYARQGMTKVSILSTNQGMTKVSIHQPRWVRPQCLSGAHASYHAAPQTGTHANYHAAPQTAKSLA